MCHVPCIMYHVSCECITCHVSCTMYHVPRAMHHAYIMYHVSCNMYYASMHHFPDMPCMKRFLKKKASVYWPAVRDEKLPSSRGYTANKPVTNRGSIAGFVFPSVYIGIRSPVLPNKSLEQLSSILWRARGSIVSWSNRPVGIPSFSAPLHPAAPP